MSFLPACGGVSASWVNHVLFISCSGLHVSADWHAHTVAKGSAECESSIWQLLASIRLSKQPPPSTSLSESQCKKRELPLCENLEVNRAEVKCADMYLFTLFTVWAGYLKYTSHNIVR